MNKQTAIICDLDGTLSLFKDGNPLNKKHIFFDRDFSKDVLNRPIAKIIRNVPVDVLIILTGRKGEYKKQTIQWLEDNIIPYDLLFMRAIGDRREDTIVKKEIYEKEIKDKYDVLFVLEDRNRIVALWRALGLICLQVAEGEF